MFQFFRTNGIELLIIKGLAASRFYPPSVPRFFNDVDIAVAGLDFSLSKQLLDHDSIPPVGIDLHCELRHLDTLPWKTLFGNSELLHFKDGNIRVPCPEDHLRVLSTHWLTDGGERKDRLWDIYYAVSNRPPTFDWNKCLEVVSPTRRGWVILTIGLAHKYLGLDISHLPFENEAKRLPDWVCRTLETEWDRGIPLLPIHTQLHNPKVLLQQIRKRIPPNPITATIDMEGDFYTGNRRWFQIGSMAKRLGPSVKRVVPAMFRK